MRTIIGGILLIMLAGCASVGNSAIKSVTAEQLRGQTQQQLVATYGPPMSRIVTIKNGRQSETLVWSYAYATMGHLESTSIGVTFDDDGTVAVVEMRH